LKQHLAQAFGQEVGVFPESQEGLKPPPPGSPSAK